MTDFISHPGPNGLVKLSGTIGNLKVTHASFVFTESDQTKMGVVATVAAGLNFREN